MSADYAQVIRETCNSLALGDMERARETIAAKYPFVPKVHAGRRYDATAMVETFVRDGFIDRYKGTRLVFPPVLRLLSHYMPREFPYHRNWKADATHPAYWQILPTIDHVVPVMRGGLDDQSNRVSCSMLTNSIKSVWMLEELGWRLQPAGDLDHWDGMMGWFIEQIRLHPDVLRHGEAAGYLTRWHRAALLMRDHIEVGRESTEDCH